MLLRSLVGEREKNPVPTHASTFQFFLFVPEPVAFGLYTEELDIFVLFPF